MEPSCSSGTLQMDSEVGYGNLVCRLMSMTGCDKATGTFCLEAANGDFWEAKALYEKQMVAATFPSCPPEALEQEEKLIQKKEFGWNTRTRKFEVDIPGVPLAVNDLITDGVQIALTVGGIVLWTFFALAMSSGRRRG